MSNVEEFPRSSQTPPTDHNGNGRERLTRLETQMEHMATKAWVLGGVVGGMVAAALITLAVAKLVLPSG